MDKHILINIGRQFGAGGRGVADVLGERLGIPVYDNELLQKAAEESGFSPAFFKKSDERKRLFRFGSLFGLNRASAYAPSAIDGTELFKYQSEAIRDIARQGNAIFLGRASDYVLRDMKCLDVFICAPLEDRVARVRERTAMTPEEAQDYRYMPEPDVPPIVLKQSHVDKIEASMPMMPNDYRSIFGVLNLDTSEREAILNYPILAQRLAESCKKNVTLAPRIAHWFSGILLAEENADSVSTAILAFGSDKAAFKRLGEAACNEIYISWEDSVANAVRRYSEVRELWASGELQKRRNPLERLRKFAEEWDESFEAVQKRQREAIENAESKALAALAQADRNRIEALERIKEQIKRAGEQMLWR